MNQAEDGSDALTSVAGAPEGGDWPAPDAPEQAPPPVATEQARAADVPAEPPSAWWYAVRRAIAEFGRDHVIDRAGALTFFSVLSLFPALIVLVSVLGLVGQGEATTNAILALVDELLPGEASAQLQEPIASITGNRGAGLGVVIGILAALWAASNYVTAFSRAMNRIYGVPEGRPAWRLRPAMYLLTALLILLVALAAVILVVSGPVAHWLGDLVGLGGTAVTVWNVVKWPVLLLVVVVILALLYYGTPNVRLRRVRWLSPGAAVAIVIGAVATVGLSLFVSNVTSLSATYGALAGVIVIMVWLWIMNLAILFGAVVDAQIERVQELRDGLPSADRMHLRLRDDRKVERSEARWARLVAQGEALRRESRD
jgi:membrane protein